SRRRVGYRGAVRGRRHGVGDCHRGPRAVSEPRGVSTPARGENGADASGDSLVRGAGASPNADDPIGAEVRDLLARARSGSPRAVGRLLSMVEGAQRSVVRDLLAGEAAEAAALSPPSPGEGPGATSDGPANRAPVGAVDG